MHTLHLGNNLSTLRGMESNTFHACVTDAPYGLNKVTQQAFLDCLQAWLAGQEYEPKGGGFMGHKWDSWVPSPTLWREVYRVLRPGAYCVVFAGNRTQDLIAMSLRLAGFELVETIFYMYGTGMPKGADPSKHIDRKLGHQRKRDVVPHIASRIHGDRPWMADAEYRMESDEPVSEEAEIYHGTRTQLKPAYEPILVMQKPISEHTIAANLLKWECGAMWIDRCRVARDKISLHVRTSGQTRKIAYRDRLTGSKQIGFHTKGGYPSNVIHDGSDAIAELFPESALELFYTSKAQPGEKDLGLDDFYWQRDDESPIGWTRVAVAEYNALPHNLRHHGNIHPTVKRLSLMQYLIRLFADKGQEVLDPFAGSGTTLCAGIMEETNVTGMEIVQEYYDMAQAKAEYYRNLPKQVELPVQPPVAGKLAPEQCAIGI